MPRTGRVGLLFALLLILPSAGCIDDFPVALDPEPRTALDQKLIGSWACLGMDTELTSDGRPGPDTTILTLDFQTHGKTYAITTIGLNQKDKAETFSAFPSLLDKQMLLNVSYGTDGPSDSEKPTFVLLRQTWLSEKVIELDFVDHDVLKDKPMKTSAELRKTIRSYRPQSELFKPFLTCIRAVRG